MVKSSLRNICTLIRALPPGNKCTGGSGLDLVETGKKLECVTYSEKNEREVVSSLTWLLDTFVQCINCVF